MIDIHQGTKIEDALIMRTGRINIALLDDSLIESFYIGFVDRIFEVHDDCKYFRLSNIETIFELFYLLGYRTSNNEILYSERIQKSPPKQEDFREHAINYLNRFNIVSFYERNTPEIQQMLP